MVKTNRERKTRGEQVTGLVMFIVLTVTCMFGITARVFAEETTTTTVAKDVLSETVESDGPIGPEVCPVVLGKGKVVYSTTYINSESDAMKIVNRLNKEKERAKKAVNSNSDAMRILKKLQKQAAEKEAAEAEEENYEEEYTYEEDYNYDYDEDYSDSDYDYSYDYDDGEDYDYSSDVTYSGTSDRNISDYEYNLLINLTSSEYGSSWVPTEEKSKIAATVLNIADNYYGGSITDAIYNSCVPYGFDPSYSYYTDDSIYDAVNNVVDNEEAWSDWNATSWYGDGTYNYFS